MLKNLRALPWRRPSVTGEALDALQAQVAGWQVVDGHHLWKAFTFPDFVQPWILSTGRRHRGSEGHHPDLLLSWGKVEVKIWTHKIDGLTESDFILAAKIDRIHYIHNKEKRTC